jgi:hypothetical protein
MISEFLHSFPHYTFTFSKVETDDLIDNPIDYGQALGFIAFWFLLAWFVYVICDLITCCCTTSTPRPYRFEIATTLSFIVIILSFYAIIPNYQTSTHVNNLLDSFDDLLSYKDALGERATRIISLVDQQRSLLLNLTAIGNLTDIDELILQMNDIETQNNEFLALSSNTTDSIESVFDDIRTYDGMRRDIVTVGLVLFAAVLIVLVILNFIHFLQQIPNIALLLLLSIIWIVSVVQLATTVALSDICEKNPTLFFDTLIHDKMEVGESQSIALYYLHCDSAIPVNPLNTYLDQASTSIDTSDQLFAPVMQYYNNTSFNATNDDIRFELNTLKNETSCDTINTIYVNIIDEICDSGLNDWFTLIAVSMVASLFAAIARCIFSPKMRRVVYSSSDETLELIEKRRSV